ncbi:unnamed protein product [Vitrella brassicaformis CCMP3155]|uniref:Alpha/beta hydrolase fold-3 domain-containing protein n=3 Tax=Vitrella brassicaformis TaxID=1169539 RepID=A0A0G4FLF0_VITBC|nr:unnamed protein product [Vitrella brassicaformis CCMP3155]|eukprot:CEM14748.1 unnamed protein product [Vitrella brassicaformis CCMP3155]
MLMWTKVAKKKADLTLRKLASFLFYISLLVGDKGADYLDADLTRKEDGKLLSRQLRLARRRLFVVRDDFLERCENSSAIDISAAVQEAESNDKLSDFCLHPRPCYGGIRRIDAADTAMKSPGDWWFFSVDDLPMSLPLPRRYGRRRKRRRQGKAAIGALESSNGANDTQGEGESPAGECGDDAMVLLYLHGGEFLSGDVRHSRREESFVLELARGTHRELRRRRKRRWCGIQRLSVFSPSYPLAYNATFQEMVDAVVEAHRELIDLVGGDGKAIILVGNGSGGNLALQLLRHGDGCHPSGIALVSPWLDLSCSGDSYHECMDCTCHGHSLRDGAYVDVERVLKGNATDSWLLPSSGMSVVDASPTLWRATALPPNTYSTPLYVSVGEDDWSRSDAHSFLDIWRRRQRQLHRRLSYSASGPAVSTLHENRRGWHSMEMWASVVPEAREALRRVCVFIADVAEGRQRPGRGGEV